MELNQRVKELEDEVKLIKNEVKQVLLDIREHILTHYQNPFTMSLSFPDEEKGEEKIAEGAKKGKAVPPEEPERESVNESLAAREVTPSLALQPSIKEKGIDLTTIAGLIRWTESSIRRVGKERVKAIVDIYQMMGYLPLNLKELLLQLIRLAEEEGPQEQVKMRDFLPILIQLDTLLGQNLKTESAVLSLLFEGEEFFQPSKGDKR